MRYTSQKPQHSPAPIALRRVGEVQGTAGASAAVPVYLSDNFGHAFGTLDTGQSWQTSSTDFSTAGGQAIAANTVFAKAYATAPAANGTLSATLGTSGILGIIARCSDFGNFIWYTTDGDAIVFQKCVGNTFNVFFRSYGAAVGDTLELTLNGGRLVCTRNGVVIGAYTDNFNQNVPKFGLASYNTAAAWSAFRLTADSAKAPAASVATTPLIVFDGDSRTLGVGTAQDRDRYVPGVIAALNPAIIGNDWLNWGITGQKQADMSSHAATSIDPLRSGRGTAKSIIVAWGGVNDLVNGSAPTTIYNAMVAYAQARKAAGWDKVVVCTVPPATYNGVTLNPTSGALKALNDAIRANTTDFDRVADIAADPAFSAANAQNNSTYYTDSIHLAAAGHRVASGIVAASLRSIGL